MLLQHACADKADYAAADGSGGTFPFVTQASPLLPNLGVANIHAYFLDLMVRPLPFSFCGESEQRDILILMCTLLVAVSICV